MYVCLCVCVRVCSYVRVRVCVGADQIARAVSMFFFWEGQGLLHTGSASRDDCGHAFSDELRVSSFP